MSNNIYLQNAYPYNQNNIISQDTLLPPLQTPQAQVALNLNQIQGFEPVKEFTDSTNTKWVLVKNSSDSTVDIPDPASLQIIESWCHEYPNLKKSKVYLYVVEGVRMPRVETEKPARILYQWFALSFVPNFNYTMITKKEWLKANVYAAPVADARLSKLYALCKIENSKQEEPATYEKLITVEELNGEPKQITRNDQNENNL